MTERAPIPTPVTEQASIEAERLPWKLRFQLVGALTLAAATVAGLGGLAYREGVVVPGAHKVAGQEEALDAGFDIPLANYADDRNTLTSVRVEGEDCIMPARVKMEFGDSYDELQRLERTDVTKANYEVALPASLDEQQGIQYYAVDSAGELQALASELGDGTTACEAWDLYEEKFSQGSSSTHQGILGGTFDTPRWVEGLSELG